MTSPPRPPFQRPPSRPSDWEPVPIPQPAEAIHTSDPETPTLAQLAERERQRATLASPPPEERPAFTSVGTEAAEPKELDGAEAPDADSATGPA